MQIETLPEGFRLTAAAGTLLEHGPGAPAVFVGQGRERMDMYRGNFDIQDYVSERVALADARVTEQAGECVVELRRYATDDVQLRLYPRQDGDNGFEVRIQAVNTDWNRFWVRLPATPEERVWGGGEQMSYFNMRGRHFPLWTSEPGVGRDKSTYVTWQSDVENRAGGDYYHTNYPQPTYLSSRKYLCHIDTTCYADFDFRAQDFHELQVWEIPARLQFRCADSYLGLVTQASLLFGRQPALPEWQYNGVVLGLKRGEPHVLEQLERARDAGMAIAALWCEDWSGVRQTSFGTRLFWDWKWQPERYPNLDTLIPQWRDEGIRFLGYANPYLCVDGDLFPQADALGYFATDSQGATAIVDFGEFECGVVDFTNPDASRWFKETILQREMIDFGLSGWMADFGEYLPIDVQLHNGVSAREEHNLWPVRWARINAEAIAERGKTDDVTFFMRAGYTGVQKHSAQLWAGDQSVDFSRHDGMVSVISGALSSGLLGNAYHHSDIGGFTSLFGNTRDAELFQRWAEMAAFTAMMRTHESNRPRDNFQWFEDAEVTAHFAHMTQVYRHFAPYLKTLVGEARAQGWPVQRALFLHHEDDPACLDLQNQYLYGPDLLVAPVHQADCDTWTVYLPLGADWEHLWSGATWTGGQHIRVAAPLGEPPVFCRTDSAWLPHFRATPGRH